MLSVCSLWLARYRDQYKYPLLLMVGMFSNHALAESIATAEISIKHNDNILHAASDSLKFSDEFVSTALEYGATTTLSGGHRMSLVGHITYADYDKYYGLNRLVVGGRLHHTKKIGIGMHVPQLHGQLAVQHVNYESDVRDIWQYAMSVGASQTLNDTMRVKGSVGYTQDVADNRAQQLVAQGRKLSNSVFDQRAYHGKISLDYNIRRDHFLSLHYTYRQGDIDSVRTDSDKAIQAASAVIVIEEQAVSRKHPELLIYKFDADTHILAAHWDWVMGERTLLGLQFERKMNDVAAGFNSQSNLFSLNFTYQH